MHSLEHYLTPGALEPDLLWDWDSGDHTAYGSAQSLVRRLGLDQPEALRQFAFDAVNQVTLHADITQGAEQPWALEALTTNIGKHITGASRDMGYGGTKNFTVNAGQYGEISSLTTGGISLPSTTVAYAYDDNGSVTDDGRCQYEWAANQRMSRKTCGSLVTTYAYDYLNRPVLIKTTDSAQAGAVINQEFLLWQGYRVVQARQGDRAEWVKATYLQDGAYDHDAGKPYYVARDRVGSPVAWTEAISGALIATLDYSLGGEREVVSGALPDTLARVGWQGMYQPADGGHQLLTVHRQYDPVRYRWLSRDPLGPVQGGGLAHMGNVYHGMGNNGLYFTDPSGLDIDFSEISIRYLNKYYPDLGQYLTLNDIVYRDLTNAAGMYYPSSRIISLDQEIYNTEINSRISLIDQFGTLAHEAIHARDHQLKGVIPTNDCDDAIHEDVYLRANFLENEFAARFEAGDLDDLLY